MTDIVQRLNSALPVARAKQSADAARATKAGDVTAPAPSPLLGCKRGPPAATHSPRPAREHDDAAEKHAKRSRRSDESPEALISELAHLFLPKRVHHRSREVRKCCIQDLGPGPCPRGPSCNFSHGARVRLDELHSPLAIYLLQHCGGIRGHWMTESEVRHELEKQRRKYSEEFENLLREAANTMAPSVEKRPVLSAVCEKRGIKLRTSLPFTESIRITISNPRATADRETEHGAEADGSVAEDEDTAYERRHGGKQEHEAEEVELAALPAQCRNVLEEQSGAPFQLSHPWTASTKESRRPDSRTSMRPVSRSYGNGADKPARRSRSRSCPSKEQRAARRPEGPIVDRRCGKDRSVERVRRGSRSRSRERRSKERDIDRRRLRRTPPPVSDGGQGHRRAGRRWDEAPRGRDRGTSPHARTGDERRPHVVPEKHDTLSREDQQELKTLRVRRREWAQTEASLRQSLATKDFMVREMESVPAGSQQQRETESGALKQSQQSGSVLEERCSQLERKIGEMEVKHEKERGDFFVQLSMLQTDAKGRDTERHHAQEEARRLRSVVVEMEAELETFRQEVDRRKLERGTVQGRSSASLPLEQGRVQSLQEQVNALSSEKQRLVLQVDELQSRFREEQDAKNQLARRLKELLQLRDESLRFDLDHALNGLRAGLCEERNIIPCVSGLPELKGWRDPTGALSALEELQRFLIDVERDGKAILKECDFQAGGFVCAFDARHGEQNLKGEAAVPEDTKGDDGFNVKYTLWQAYLSFRRDTSKEKNKVIQLQRVQRDKALDDLLIRLRSVRADKFFHSVHVRTFEDEDVDDQGGAAAEVFSLAFEQLRDYKVPLLADGKRVGFRLFERTPSGIFYVPTRPASGVIMRAVQESEDVKVAYTSIGKLFAKAVVDGHPISPAFAFDFVIAFLLGEGPSMLSVQTLLEYLLAYDAGFNWMEKYFRPGAPLPAASDLRGGKDSTPLSAQERDKFLSEFFEDKVCAGRQWALQHMRGGFGNESCGRTLHEYFIAIFTPGAQRRRLICGDHIITGPKLHKCLLFTQHFRDCASLEVIGGLFAEAVASLTSEEAQNFLRAVTGLSGIPEGLEITVSPLELDQPHMRLATCTHSILLPIGSRYRAGDLETMKARLIEVCHPKCLPFKEERQC